MEVINAGVPGIHSHVEHLLVRDKILGMDPDLLIVHDGNNDIFSSVNNTGINERWSGLYNLFGADGYAGTYQHLRDTVYLLSLIDKHSKVIGIIKEHASPLPMTIPWCWKRWPHGRGGGPGSAIPAGNMDSRCWLPSSPFWVAATRP